MNERLPGRGLEQVIEDSAGEQHDLQKKNKAEPNAEAVLESRMDQNDAWKWERKGCGKTSELEMQENLSKNFSVL